MRARPGENRLMTPLFLLATLVLLAALIALAIIDWRSYRLPDALTLPLIAAGLAFAWALDRPVYLHLGGAVFGYLAFVAIELAYLRLRGRAGLGRGDAKLLAAGGAWCGLAALPLIVLFASLSALVAVFVLQLAGRAVTATTVLAFGPFLAVAIALAWALRALLPGFPLYL